MFVNKLILIIGPMFAGKTTELIRKIRRYKVAGYSCLIIKYAKDNRYKRRTATDAISTHDNDTIEAVSCLKLEEVIERARKFNVIGIDEGQFFEDVVDFSEEMTNSGKVVVISALSGTFERKSFGKIAELVPKAEEIECLTAICMDCQKEASFTMRTTSSKETTLIGGKEHYKPVCRNCYFKNIEEEKNKCKTYSESKDNFNVCETTDKSIY